MEAAVNMKKRVEAEVERDIIKPVGTVLRGRAYQPPSDTNTTTFSTTTSEVTTKDESSDSDTSNGSPLNNEKVKGKSTNDVSNVLKNGGKRIFYFFHVFIFLTFLRCTLCCWFA